MMRIGIDAMGGDYAPLECLRGALLCKKEFGREVQLVLIGDKTKLLPLLKQEGAKEDSFEIIHTTEVIEMGESPARSVVQKPDSSIVVGFNLLKDKKIDAFASAGNTGAMLVGAMLSIKTVPGVIRPTISTIVPRENGKLGILLDVGANADCKPEFLLQFAILGSLYSKYIFNVDNPKVGLLSIGEEEGKGNILTQAAFDLMKDSDKINFVGNVEGRDIFADTADVIVCDGFTGNIVLKFGESFYDLIKKRKITDHYFDSFNYENYGGTPILGANAPVVIAHGISNALAFHNMITLAKNLVEANLVAIFENAFVSLTEKDV
jgi:phosphate acyltransferase